MVGQSAAMVGQEAILLTVCAIPFIWGTRRASQCSDGGFGGGAGIILADGGGGGGLSGGGLSQGSAFGGRWRWFLQLRN